MSRFDNAPKHKTSIGTQYMETNHKLFFENCPFPSPWEKKMIEEEQKNNQKPKQKES